MKDIFRFGILVAGLLGLFVCVGCGGGAPPEDEAETEELYESAEYENEMMGSGAGEKP